MTKTLDDLLNDVMDAELNAIGREAVDNLKTFVIGLGILEKTGGNIDNQTKSLCIIERAVKMTIDGIIKCKGRDYRAEVEPPVQDAIAKANVAKAAEKATEKKADTYTVPFGPVDGCNCLDCTTAREKANPKA